MTIIIFSPFHGINGKDFLGDSLTPLRFAQNDRTYAT